ncbi:MAG TPA: M48 family metallopeptidase [Candidatus Binatia bacterium]|nr:M48 family metallopeptidase [Candidatus Binatia bacterium]
MSMKLPFGLALMALALVSCAVSEEASRPSDRDSAPQVRDIRQVDPRQARRLYDIMTPLLKVMNRPRTPQDVRVGIIDAAEINAANAGGGQFYVTTGLLQKANDQQLRGVMAHEIAHEDLGHAAQLQILGAGLNIGMVLLEQLFPGSSAVTPIAGTLIARGYTRSEESAADRHGVEILGRAGYPKEVMIDALRWVASTSGGGGKGGFLSTHPATEDRIAELSRLR